jgi:LAO/AO transport system kinase
MLSSAYSGLGIEELWNNVMDYVAFTKSNGFFYQKRQKQNIRILYETIEASLKEHFYNNEIVEHELATAKENILADKVSGYKAAEQLIALYFDNISKNK